MGQLDIDNRFGYAGYIWDQHLGIYHVRHRAYDPFAGRWLQPDPLALMGPELLLALTSSDGSNLYAYVGNSPNGFVDPYGLYWEETATDLANNGEWWGFGAGMAVGVAGGLLEGRDDGVAIAANEFTFGKFEGLNEYSEQLIVDGGDWYAAGAGFSAASRNTAMAAAFVAGGSAVAASSVGKTVVAYAVAVPGATTVAPIVGTGAQIAGTALTGYTLGTGIYQIYDGDYRNGFENAGSSGLGTAAGGAVGKAMRYVVKVPGTAQAAAHTVGKWSARQVLGRTVYQRSYLFDPNQLTYWRHNGVQVWGTNVEAMSKGYAPIGFDGRKVVLHHLGQSEPGNLAEVGGLMHSKKVQHKQLVPGTSWRRNKNLLDQFDRYRGNYWVERSKDFTQCTTP